MRLKQNAPTQRCAGIQICLIYQNQLIYAAYETLKENLKEIH